MACLHASFFSKVLAKEVALKALVPEQGRGPFPVLYLLHGLSDDYSSWTRRTRIEWYVRDLPLIVVMPDGFRSFYTDHHRGPAYGRYMIEDVLGFAERTFPIMRSREARGIGGLSMGGYGSLRLALAHPELFTSVHSHSGAVWDFSKPMPPERKALFAPIFGPKPKGSEHDVYALAQKVSHAGRLPKISIDCGVDDYLIEQHRALHACFERTGLSHAYAEFPGNHGWDYWDEHIQAALQFHAQALRIG